MYHVLMYEHNIKMLHFLAVTMPPSQRLSMEEVYDRKTNRPRPEILKDHFAKEGRIDEQVALKIIYEGTALLKQEKTILDIEAPVTGTDRRKMR